MIKTFAPLCAAAVLALAASTAPSEARGQGRHHHDHGRGHHDRGHHHGHRHGWHRGGWHRGGWSGGGWHHARPRVFWRGGGGPTVIVGGVPVPYGWRGPHRVYAGGYGTGCSTTRRVSWTPWGLRRIVTTKTCYVP